MNPVLMMISMNQGGQQDNGPPPWLAVTAVVVGLVAIAGAGFAGWWMWK